VELLLLSGVFLGHLLRLLLVFLLELMAGCVVGSLLFGPLVLLILFLLELLAFTLLLGIQLFLLLLIFPVELLVAGVWGSHARGRCEFPGVNRRRGLRMRRAGLRAQSR